MGRSDWWTGAVGVASKCPRMCVCRRRQVDFAHRRGAQRGLMAKFEGSLFISRDLFRHVLFLGCEERGCHLIFQDNSTKFELSKKQYAEHLTQIRTPRPAGTSMCPYGRCRCGAVVRSAPTLAACHTHLCRNKEAQASRFGQLVRASFLPISVWLAGSPEEFSQCQACPRLPQAPASLANQPLGWLTL